MQSSSSSGFTIVEVIVVIVVGAILTGLLFGPLDDMYRSYNKNLFVVTRTADIHSALDTIASDLADSSGFVATKSVMESPFGANNDETAWSWQGEDEDHRVLLATGYATTIRKTADNADERQLTLLSNCKTPYTNTYVYFVRDSTLYRRIIANDNGHCASTGVAQQQTCALDTLGDSCQAIDAVLCQNVTSFTVDYYDRSISNTPFDDQYTDQQVPPRAQVVNITLVTEPVKGDSAEFKRSLRIVRGNEASL